MCVLYYQVAPNTPQPINPKGVSPWTGEPYDAMGDIKRRHDFFEAKVTVERLRSDDLKNPKAHTMPIPFDGSDICDDLMIHGYRSYEMKYSDAFQHFSFIYFVNSNVPVVVDTVPWKPFKYIHALRTVHLILLSDVAGLPVRAIIGVHPPVETADTVQEFSEYYESLLELIESVKAEYSIPLLVAGDTNFFDENHLLLRKLRKVLNEVTFQNVGGTMNCYPNDVPVMGESERAKSIRAQPPAYPDKIFVDSKTLVQEGAAKATFLTFPGANATTQQISKYLGNYPELHKDKCQSIRDLNVLPTGYVSDHAAIIFTSKIPSVNQ